MSRDHISQVVASPQYTYALYGGAALVRIVVQESADCIDQLGVGADLPEECLTGNAGTIDQDALARVRLLDLDSSLHQHPHEDPYATCGQEAQQ